MNELETTKKWFEIAIPEPTIESTCVQIGCAYEETGELSRTLDDSPLMGVISDFADCYKACHQDIIAYLKAMSDEKKVQMLDDIVDEIVTRVGIAHHMGFDIIRALQEVNRSNFSKFEDGMAVFDENGKIKKGEHYSPPNLKQFI